MSEDTIREAVRSGRMRAKRLSESPRSPFLIREAALDEWYDGLPDADEEMVYAMPKRTPLSEARKKRR
ncbi:hypothetical protein KDN32_17805 [Nocardioides sp. J2M5]|nr:hypothetical protein [Nocardioides palaemonis]